MKKNIINVPQGYKDSPLGIIPKEWKVLPLKKLGNVFSGGTPDTNEKSYWNGNILWCTPSDITKLRTKLITDTTYKITELGLKNSSAALLPPGCILVCTRATIGNAAITVKEMSTNQGFKNIEPIKKDVDIDWLFYYITLNKHRLVQLGVGSTFLEVSKKDFEKFKVIVPPLSEQQKIAEVLSTWDEAIEKQSQLVEKLELRKKGLMQQLLTGKKRLPGFVEEWKKARLGDFADVVGGGTPDTSNENYWYGNIAWFTPSEIGKNKYVYKSQRYITEEGLNNSSARLLPIGTILFTSRATIGLKAILKMEATTNQGFQSLIVSNSNNTDFFFYLLDILDNVIKRKASGSTFPEISAKSLKNIMISIPSLAEQNAIAEILSSCDKEISLANRELDTLRKEKKGLMQVLLTGKKRIV